MTSIFSLILSTNLHPENDLVIKEMIEKNPKILNIKDAENNTILMLASKYSKIRSAESTIYFTISK